jgi:hypothetical protein
MFRLASTARRLKPRREYRLRPNLCETLERRITPSSGLPPVQMAPRTEGFLSSSVNPSTVGEPVTFRYAFAVAQYVPDGGPTSETITFRDGSNVLGTSTSSDSASTLVTTSTLAAGDHAITATRTLTFANAPTLSTVSPVLIQTVKAATNGEYHVSTSASVSGQDVTFTADVTSQTPAADAPTGTVTFYATPLTAGLQPAPVAIATVPVQGGVATFHTSSLPADDYAIRISYSGDAHFIAGSNPDYILTLNVARAGTTTVVASSATVATSGQGITYTATVAPSASGSGRPTGPVVFYDGATPIGTANLVGGQASISLTASLPARLHFIHAIYGGDTNFVTSGSNVVTETVSRRGNSHLTAFAQVARGGVRVVANLLPAVAGGGTPTGVVTLLVDGRAIASRRLSHGSTGTFVVPASHSNKTFRLRYSGDPNTNPFQSTMIVIGKSAHISPQWISLIS